MQAVPKHERVGPWCSWRTWPSSHLHRAGQPVPGLRHRQRYEEEATAEEDVP